MTQEEKGKYVLSEKFSQDPLEQHFGKHRWSGGCSDNPQLDVSMQQEVALCLLNSELISDFTENTQGRQDTRPPVTNDDRDYQLSERNTKPISGHFDICDVFNYWQAKG